MESSISFFGRFQEGGAKWREGVPASDGAFDYVPRDEGTVLSVGVACKSWAMFGGKVVPQGRYKYSGGVLANDGLQYIGCFLALVSQATAVTTPEAYGDNPPIGLSTMECWMLDVAVAAEVSKTSVVPAPLDVQASRAESEALAGCCAGSSVFLRPSSGLTEVRRQIIQRNVRSNGGFISPPPSSASICVVDVAIDAACHRDIRTRYGLHPN